MKNIKKFLFAHRNKFQQNHCNLKKKFREIKRNLRTGVCYSIVTSRSHNKIEVEQDEVSCQVYVRGMVRIRCPGKYTKNQGPTRWNNRG